MPSGGMYSKGGDYHDPIARLARDRKRRGKKPSQALTNAKLRDVATTRGARRAKAGTVNARAAEGMLSGQNLPAFAARKGAVDEDVAILLRQLRKKL